MEKMVENCLHKSFFFLLGYFVAFISLHLLLFLGVVGCFSSLSNNYMNTIANAKAPKLYSVLYSVILNFVKRTKRYQLHLHTMISFYGLITLLNKKKKKKRRKNTTKFRINLSLRKWKMVANMMLLSFWWEDGCFKT